MANASAQSYAVGARYGVVFALNADGRPNASSTTVYEGVEVVGIKSLSLTTPDARQVTHYGIDRVLAVDYLPPTEPVSGEILTAQDNLTLDALLDSTATFNVGESTMLVGSSDEQGDEPDVGILIFQQALDASTRIRNWRFMIFPKARVKAMSAGMAENPGESRYTFVAAPTTKHLWGTALAAGTEYATEASYTRGHSVYKPKLVAFQADGTEDEFTFPAAAQAANTSKIAVWVDGTLTTTGITKATTGVTWGTAPADGADIVIFYEYE